MKRSSKMELIAVALGTLSAIAVIAALVSAALGSGIAAILCVALCSAAAIVAAALESFRQTK